MKNEQLVVFFLNWIATNAPQLTFLLVVLIPIMALLLVGYALYVLHNNISRGGVND